MSKENVTKIACSLKEASVASGGPEYYQLFGTSMLPFLKEQDKLIVQPQPACSLVQGDIIVYERNQKIIIHRFMKKKRDSEQSWIVWTRGDNSVFFDEPFKDELLIGRVNRVLRGDREWDLNHPIHRFFNRLIGFFSFIDVLAWSFLKSTKQVLWPGLRLKPPLGRICRSILACPRVVLSRIYT